MAADRTIEFVGVAELRKNLAAISPEARQQLATALEAEAFAIKAESERITPKRTGQLRQWTGVSKAEVMPAEILVRIYAGGVPTAAYALAVHEHR